MNDPIVGIDLGTTNSLVGIVDSGFPILLADADGQRLTPSVVEFGEGEPLVGRLAKDGISSIKRLMGARAGEIDPAGLPYAVVGAPGTPARVKAGPSDLLPEEVSACILRKLKADAERALGQSVHRAVITVPAYFNDAQRSATKVAGELAGFTVERIINEPTAAALAYGLDRLGARARVAVYDLGGGTFDISILEMNLGVFEVLSTNGNTRLGGDDIDAALAASAGLGLPAARAAKVRLSTEEAINPRLTREWLERIARPIVERTRDHCLRALADAKLRPADLDAVILVGGATRMPLVRALVAEIFGREPDTSQNPDEAVALGAAIQAGILSGSVSNVVLLDVTPLSLGIETFGGLTNVIIPRNTTIPTKAGELFTNAVAGQRTVRIHVVQGERERAADNWTLGAFDLDFAPGLRGSARVGVQFEIDADGILQVLARDTHTGAEKIVPMTSAVDVSDEQVEAMIAESVEHAFDDYGARLLVETRLKSEEMLPAVQHALGLVGARLPASERAEIEALAGAVRAALAAGDDLPTLRAANAALDAGTQGLAAILIEQAASGQA